MGQCIRALARAPCASVHSPCAPRRGSTWKVSMGHMTSQLNTKSVCMKCAPSLDANRTNPVVVALSPCHSCCGCVQLSLQPLTLVAMCWWQKAPVCMIPGCGKPTWNGFVNDYCSSACMRVGAGRASAPAPQATFSILFHRLCLVHVFSGVVLVV